MVLHIISSFRRGGRERQLATLYKYSKSESKPLIVSMNYSENTYADEYDIKDIIYLKSKNPYKRLIELYRVTKRIKPIVIWSWGGYEASFGLILSWITGISHVNGSIRHGIVKFNRKQLWRMLILHFSKYRVANSYAGLKANKLSNGYILYNGVDNSLISTRVSAKEIIEIKKRLGIEPSKIVLLSIANLVPYKDYFTVLKALKIVNEKFNNFVYFIIGEGPMRNKINNYISELGLQYNVILLGRQKDVKNYLQISDIFIHSSKGEGCSNAILEAMSNGLPVIATDTGGTKEIIDDKYGFLFKYKDYLKLSELVYNLINNKNLRKTLSNISRQRIKEKFSVDFMVENYYKITNNVIDGKKRL